MQTWFYGWPETIALERHFYGAQTTYFDDKGICVDGDLTRRTDQLKLLYPEDARGEREVVIALIHFIRWKVLKAVQDAGILPCCLPPFKENAAVARVHCDAEFVDSTIRVVHSLTQGSVKRASFKWDH